MCVVIYYLREWLSYANRLSHIYLWIYQKSEGDFLIYSSNKLKFQLNFNMAFIGWLMKRIVFLTEHY